MRRSQRAERARAPGLALAIRGPAGVEPLTCRGVYNQQETETEGGERLAVLCPAGVGRQKLGIVFTAIALRACGAWGRRTLAEKVFGHQPANVSPATKAFVDFIALIHEHFRPRMAKPPVFRDQSLRRVTMPVLAIVGARDVMLDSAATKRRLERTVPNAEITMLPDAGHVITGQTERVVKFLIGVQADGGNQ